MGQAFFVKVDSAIVRRNTQEQKRVNDIRPTRKSQISLRQQKFLGQRIFRGHGRQEREDDRELHQDPTRRRLRKGSDLT